MTSPGTASISLNGGQRWRAFWVCVSVAALTILDLSKVNVALPSIQNDLGFTNSSLAWVINAYRNGDIKDATGRQMATQGGRFSDTERLDFLLRFFSVADAGDDICVTGVVVCYEALEGALGFGMDFDDDLRDVIDRAIAEELVRKEVDSDE